MKCNLVLFIVIILIIVNNNLIYSQKINYNALIVFSEIPDYSTSTSSIKKIINKLSNNNNNVLRTTTIKSLCGQKVIFKKANKIDFSNTIFTKKCDKYYNICNSKSINDSLNHYYQTYKIEIDKYFFYDEKVKLDKFNIGNISYHIFHNTDSVYEAIIKSKYNNVVLFYNCLGFDDTLMTSIIAPNFISPAEKNMTIGYDGIGDLFYPFKWTKIEHASYEFQIVSNGTTLFKTITNDNFFNINKILVGKQADSNTKYKYDVNYICKVKAIVEKCGNDKVSEYAEINFYFNPLKEGDGCNH